MSINKDKNIQLLVTFPKELKREIEDYQFENRIPSRTAAILDLIRNGLNKGKKEDRT